MFIDNSYHLGEVCFYWRATDTDLTSSSKNILRQCVLQPQAEILYELSPLARFLNWRSRMGSTDKLETRLPSSTCHPYLLGKIIDADPRRMNEL